MSALLDVRLVVCRDGAVRVSVDGRPVALDATSDHAEALLALARAASGIAWTERRTPGEVLADPASALYSRAST